MTQKNEKKQYGTIIMTFLFMVIGAVCGFLILDYVRNSLINLEITKALFEVACLLPVLYLGLFTQIIIHETGHLIFGLLTGYRFSSFRIFRWTIMKTEEGFRLRSFELAGTGGQVLMIPPEEENGNIPFVLYNAGGVLMNLITALIAIVCSFRAVGLAGLLLKMFAAVGIGYALTNGIPLSTDTVNDDGSNLLDLLRCPAARRAYADMFRVNTALTEGKRLKDMPEEWFRVREGDDLSNSLIYTIAVYHANRLMDEDRFDEAEEEMRVLMEEMTAPIALYESIMKTDRIFIALIKGRTELAQTLLDENVRKVMTSMKSAPSIMRTQYAIALLQDHDEEQAEKLRSSYDKICASYPYPGEAESEKGRFAMVDEISELQKTA